MIARVTLLSSSSVKDLYSMSITEFFYYFDALVAESNSLREEVHNGKQKGI